jgi:hypothetical protein
MPKSCSNSMLRNTSVNLKRKIEKESCANVFIRNHDYNFSKKIDRCLFDYLLANTEEYLIRVNVIPSTINA